MTLGPALEMPQIFAIINRPMHHSFLSLSNQEFAELQVPEMEQAPETNVSQKTRTSLKFDKSFFDDIPMENKDILMENTDDVVKIDVDKTNNKTISTTIESDSLHIYNEQDYTEALIEHEKYADYNFEELKEDSTYDEVDMYEEEMKGEL